MRLTVFYDYTCAYSFRLWRALSSKTTPPVEVAWRTFSLRETNREPGTPSLFDDDKLSSVSIMALALGHAAREADFARYHASVFEAMHAEQRKVTRSDLLSLAAAAGVEAGAFERERRRWLQSVANEHGRAVEEWGLFGTPSVVFEDRAPMFVKLSAVPEPDRVASLLETLRVVVLEQPLLELKRPREARTEAG